MTHRLRPARDGDLPAVLRIVHDAYAPYIPRIGRRPGPMDDDYAARIREAAVTLAEDPGGVAGLSVLRLDPAPALLDNVAVAPRAQGRGLGRALIAAAETRAREAGHDRVTLYAHVAMVENRALYARLGYAETHRATEDGLHRVYMAKPL